MGTCLAHLLQEQNGKEEVVCHDVGEARNRAVRFGRVPNLASLLLHVHVIAFYRYFKSTEAMDLRAYLVKGKSLIKKGYWGVLVTKAGMSLRDHSL